MFGRSATAELVTRGLNLDKKVILCTGITSGIGKETARVLALRGATVLGTGRTADSIHNVCSEIGPNAIPLHCEMSSPQSIQSLLREGVEQQFYINHVAHYKIVSGLLDILNPDGRVIIVSSDLHKNVSLEDLGFSRLDCSNDYNPVKSYVLSKFANVTYARVLALQFEGTRKKAFALHPGLIKTNILRHQNVLIRAAGSVLGPLFFKSIERGAATQCFAAVHPDASAAVTGYLENCKEVKTHPEVNNRGVQDRLMTITAEVADRE